MSSTTGKTKIRYTSGPVCAERVRVGKQDWVKSHDELIIVEVLESRVTKDNAKESVEPTEKKALAQHVEPKPMLSFGNIAGRYQMEELPTTAAEILRGFLASNAEVDRRTYLAILAEPVEFTPEQENLLAPALLRFIKEKRDSNAPSILTAVSSAVRKYVGIIKVSEIGHLAALLETGHRMVLPLDIQLELAKMIARKFAANPPSRPDPEPLLAEKLELLASAHLNPYVLEDENAAVAMNALLGLAGMLSPKFGQAMQTLREPVYAWFTGLLRRRLQGVVAEWENHPLAGQCADVISGLHRLVNLVQPS